MVYLHCPEKKLEIPVCWLKSSHKTVTVFQENLFSSANNAACTLRPANVAVAAVVGYRAVSVRLKSAATLKV